MKNNSKSKYSKLIESADELYGQKRYDEALMILDKIPEECEEYSLALFMKSMILGVAGDDEESFELYKEFLKVKFGRDISDINEKFHARDMDDPHELFQCGLSLFHIFKDYKKSITYFNRSLRIDPDQADVIYYKALALAQIGRFEKAVKIMDRAIDINPSNPRYWNDNGVFLSELNHVAKAHHAFDMALKLEPNAETWSNKGALYCRTSNMNRALECFDEALKINPKDVYSIVCKAGIYSETGDFKKAEKLFKKAKRINSRNPAYLTEMGKHLINKNEFKKSISYLDESLEIDDESALSWMYKSIALSELGRDVESEKCFKKAIELDPASMDVFDEVI